MRAGPSATGFCECMDGYYQNFANNC